MSAGEQVERRPPFFGLMWSGREEAQAAASTPPSHHLVDAQGEPCALDVSSDVELGIKPPKPHLIIEGDNLEGMKLLRPTFGGSVDVIYMDPPYNTGKDFIYQDRFTESLQMYRAQSERANLTSSELRGRRHASWLTMIYPRLMLARALLSPRGVLCVSIDDHEVHHLKVILDEVMGTENEIATIIVSLNPKGRQLGRFATSHEYLLIYAKEAQRCALEYASADLVNPHDFPHVDEVGSYRLLPLRNSNKRFNPKTRPTLYYPLYINPDSGEVSTTPQERWVEVYPVFGSGEPAVWRWSTLKAERESHALFGSIVKGRLGPRWDVKQRDYNHPHRKKKLKSIWGSDEIGSTDKAARELTSLGLGLFETPKPTALLQRILALMPADSLVLDPFAGSGTLGEATLRQNLKDNGTRRYVMIQNAQPTHDSDVPTIAALTRERMRRVALAISDESRAHEQVSFDFKALYLQRAD